MTSELGLSLSTELLLVAKSAKLRGLRLSLSSLTHPTRPPWARLTLHVWVQDHEEEGPGQRG